MSLDDNKKPPRIELPTAEMQFYTSIWTVLLPIWSRIVGLPKDLCFDIQCRLDLVSFQVKWKSWLCRRLLLTDACIITIYVLHWSKDFANMDCQQIYIVYESLSPTGNVTYCNTSRFRFRSSFQKVWESYSLVGPRWTSAPILFLCKPMSFF